MEDNTALTQEIKKKKKASRGLLIGPSICVILLLFSLLIHKWNLENVGYTAVLGIAGVIFGWGVGFLLAPSTDFRKKVKINKAGISIIAFFAGYLLAKIDPVIFYFLNPDIMLKQPTYGIRFLIFIICLIISIINMYVYGQYLDDLARVMEFEPNDKNISKRNSSTSTRKRNVKNSSTSS